MNTNNTEVGAVKSAIKTAVEQVNKTFEVQIYEKVYYTLTVSAQTESEARKLVRGINKGNSCISDFQPDQNGGSCPSNFGNVVIQSVQSI